MNNFRDLEPQPPSTTGEADSGPSQQRRDEAPSAAAGGGELSVMSKIMIVDDEELSIEMLQAFLEDVGYKNFGSS